MRKVGWWEKGVVTRAEDTRTHTRLHYRRTYSQMTPDHAFTLRLAVCCFKKNLSRLNTAAPHVLVGLRNK